MNVLRCLTMNGGYRCIGPSTNKWETMLVKNNWTNFECLVKI